MAEGKGPGINPCKCDENLESGHSGICSSTDCPKCYSCCGAGCAGCIILCKDVKDGVCKCSLCGCECRKNREVLERKRACKDSGCSRCRDKCQNVEVGGRCICYLCNCGCNGVNCQCCRWCNPVTTCGKEGKCDTEEKHGEHCPKGKCQLKPGDCSNVKCMCKEMGIRVEKGSDLCVCKCSCGKQCPRILCPSKNGSNVCPEKSTDGKCGCKCSCSCNAYGKYYCKDHNDGKCLSKSCNIIFYGIGQCRFACTNCGRLCDQDRCMIWIRVIVIGLIILASLFVMRAIFPEKFYAIMTKIRATFPISSGRPGRSLSNLVGDTIPEETNIDRYPAFRPRAYAGLA